MKRLWTNGTIYTMESSTATVEAVLVEAGEIIAVGEKVHLQAVADEVIDLKGAVMYPGFVDSHLHMIGYGDTLQRLDVSDVKSGAQLLEKVQLAAKDLQPGEWLIGDGWNDNQFNDGHIPTKEELDTVCENPLLLNRICHHVILVNSAAIKSTKLTNDVVEVEGGKIGRHLNGELNGLFYEQATNLITSALVTDGKDYVASLKKSLTLAIEDMLSYGLTGGHTEDMGYYGSFENPLTAFNEVIGEEKNFRVHLLRHHSVFEQMIEKSPHYADFVEVGAMKIFADGSFGGSTAALFEPYANDLKNSGLLIHTDEQMAQYFQLARNYNETVAIHCIGDAALEQVLNCIEKYPAPAGKRDRLIHCCLVTEEQLTRMKQLPVILDLQPAFVPSDFPWVLDKLGRNREGHLYAWKTLLDTGLMCAAGTDAPIEAISPIETIYAAVERKKVNDTHDGYGKEQKLTRYEAVKMYTIGSAQAICKEHERGMIKIGYDADFSIFDRDLFLGTNEEMLKAKAIQTVVAGKIVFERH